MTITIKSKYGNNLTVNIGDKVGFSCNGKGRGGHYHVTVIITKFNRKTFDGVEASNSYKPGTLWRVNYNQIINTVDRAGMRCYADPN